MATTKTTAITIESLLKDLRKVGIRGKIEFGKIKAPKTVDADELERSLRECGWSCVRSGMYYTERMSMEQSMNMHGIYEKDGMEAHVYWGSTSSTNPPSVGLKQKVA